ncbi:MAG: hypothetical protein LBD30_04790 [Verrucomicrobiales bacterium]|jgi:hypothetical protein|nr:hypothetical protein [Verrucomicrobiales bacterium]
MSTWTLTINNSAKTAAEWGASDLRVNLANQSADTLTFTLDGTAYDSSLPFAHGSLVSLHQDNTRVFHGRVTAIRRAATPMSEGISVTVSGPWWWLETSLSCSCARCCPMA